MRWNCSQPQSWTVSPTLLRLSSPQLCVRFVYELMAAAAEELLGSVYGLFSVFLVLLLLVGADCLVSFCGLVLTVVLKEAQSLVHFAGVSARQLARVAKRRGKRREEAAIAASNILCETFK